MSALPLSDGVTRLSQYIQPGQLYVARTPTTLTTILGSCVSVCLWDAQEGVGGMNHFMLPQLAGSNMKSARFGSFAMHELFEKAVSCGAHPSRMKARVFGGACMFGELKTAAQLGLQNAELALDFLSHRGIEVVQTDIGGTRGRKLRFSTDEGAAWLTLI